ncbi:GIY-YIG nuclease family protein [Hydrogenovibrio halophilus]|uniref:GIY-YIG nuclease family protein n=1 Tax=Hydrogenovibrio halophilus TaxID=373391 RepID=UPI001B7FDB41|nr:GIY-YIG nuclease family protein [Hydrogenovibrio halophilus]
MNWTGHALTGPRSKLPEIVKRPECSRTGVYFLIGTDPDNAMRPLVYIGESDDVAQRLKQHNRPENQGGKDFWEKVCLITSKDQNLTKSHVKYLESQLIALAKNSGRCGLVNGTSHEYLTLPESDRADMSFFIDQIRMILPVLGLNFLRDQQTLANSDQSNIVATTQDSPTFEMRIPKYGIVAEAQEVEGEFIVQAKSLARDHWASNSDYTSYKPLYQQLVEDKILIPDHSGNVRFIQDQAFNSPSAAAAVISGRPANGRTTWKDKKSGKSYGQWQSELTDNT